MLINSSVFSSFIGTFFGVLFGAFFAFWPDLYFHKNKQKKIDEKKRAIEYNRIVSTIVALDDNIDTILLLKGQYVHLMKNSLNSMLALETNPQNFTDSFFQSDFIVFPSQFFNRASSYNNLAFISEKKPGFLDPIQKAYNFFNKIDFDINTYNYSISERDRLNSTPINQNQIKEVTLCINNTKKYLEILESTIDSALSYSRFSVECLRDYTKEYLNIPIKWNKIENRFDALMPPADNIKKYRELIKEVSK